MAQLLTEDKNLRVVLKEFPILGPGSVAAAKVAVAVSRTNASYWAFHQALYESRGEVTEDTALGEARTLGLDADKLKAEAAAPDVAAVIQSSYDLAGKLGVNGTPTYIIGDAIIPGAVDISQLRQAISNMRKCGKTSCESTTG
jgi:protein-disulfide isomerase